MGGAALGGKPGETKGIIHIRNGFVVGIYSSCVNITITSQHPCSTSITHVAVSLSRGCFTRGLDPVPAAAYTIAGVKNCLCVWCRVVFGSQSFSCTLSTRIWRWTFTEVYANTCSAIFARVVCTLTLRGKENAGQNVIGKNYPNPESRDLVWSHESKM